MVKGTKLRVWSIGMGVSLLALFLLATMSFDLLSPIEETTEQEQTNPSKAADTPSPEHSVRSEDGETDQSEPKLEENSARTETTEGKGSEPVSSGNQTEKHSAFSPNEGTPTDRNGVQTPLTQGESPIAQKNKLVEQPAPVLKTGRDKSKFTLPNDIQSVDEGTTSKTAHALPPNTLARAKAAGLRHSSNTFFHKKSVTMRCDQGTILKIPPEAFEYEDGTSLPVDAPVKLEVREFYKIFDILMAGLTTHGPDGVLESGGMVHVSATSFGKPLRLVEGKRILLRFNADLDATEGMELYHGEENRSAVEWVQAALPKAKETVTVESPIKPIPASLVLLDGSISGASLSTAVKSNRKLDLDKEPSGGETLSGTAHVWGSLSRKALGGTALFSNGVWLMRFPDGSDSAPEPTLKIDSFHQPVVSPKGEDWFDMEKESHPSSLALEHLPKTGGFVCRTPPQCPESNFEVRFPWGNVKPARKDNGAAFFVMHQLGTKGAFTTHLGCLSGETQVSGKGVGTHHLSTGDALVLTRKQGKTTNTAPPRTLSSGFEGWEYWANGLPDSEKKTTLAKVLRGQSQSVLTSYASRDRSIQDYYRSVQEEPMRRIERQFSMTQLGWKNLDKPGQRASAADVKVDTTPWSSGESSEEPESLGDIPTPIVRAVYKGSSSCVLIDNERFVPSGDALLVAVSYHPTTFEPKVDYLNVSFRPGPNHYKLAPGKKSPDDLREAVSNWKNAK